MSGTLIIVNDLDKCTAFYRDVFKLPYVGSDPGVSTFKLQDHHLILLSPAGAAEIMGVEPGAVNIEGNPRVIVSLGVENVDATYETLKAAGVTFLHPPTDKPWGIRLAIFTDPEGNIWDINQERE